MKKMTFEEFLSERHAGFYNGTDDDMPDAFNHWLSELDGEEYLEYGNFYGRSQAIAGAQEIINKI